MTTKDLPLIRLSAIDPFLLKLKRQDAEHLLAAHSLPTRIPASPDLFVSAQVMYQLVEQTATIARDRFLGFHVGRSINPIDWTPIAASIESSTTIGGLLGRFVVHASEHSTATAFYLNSNQRRSSFGFRRIVEPSVVPAQNDAFYLGLLSALLMSASQLHWDSSKVLFTIVDPTTVPTSDEKLRIVPGDNLGMRVSFPTQWLFEEHSLGASGVIAHEARHEAPESIVEAIRVALQPYLHERDLDVDRASRICGIERRRLSRSLHKHGTTMRQIIADLRCEIAERELRESNKRIREVGEIVGFSDAAVFSRAFKNWTGQSPLHYRQSRRT